MVDELVHQFTDPYAFYRELIQNSIDAGSTRIDVTLSFRPGKDDGLAVASVQDWGEGMSRRIIDDYLLTKFRSSKENDRTKIGKYGIGFVSIFALDPDAVSVDTGRDGESWRVLFKKDRSYELLKSTETFEGTRVTLHKRMSPDAYEELVSKSRDAVTRWCRHSDVEVTFAAGTAGGSAPPAQLPVLQEPNVDAPFQVEHVEEGLRIVLGPPRTEPPMTGFYNRGLTLLETTEPLLPNITMKIISRLLEHTLTRDNVRRDEAFARVLETAKKLAFGKLLDELPEQLRKAAERPDGANDWRALWTYAAPRLPRESLWLRHPGGGAFKATDVKPKSKLVCSETSSPVAQRMVAAGHPVIEGNSNESFMLAMLTFYRTKLSCDVDRWFTYAEPPTVAQPLAFTLALAELLKGAGCAVAEVAIAEVRGASENQPWFFTQALGRPTYIVDAGAVLKRGHKRPILCFNRKNALIADAEPLLTTAPRLAALLMARLLLVRVGLLDDETDAYLTGWALT